MKRLIAAVVLLLFIIGICYTGNRTVTHIHNETLKILNECETAILSENNTKALSAARSAVSYWKKHRILLSVFINHSRYEQAEIAFVRISRLVAGSTAIDALPECAEAKVILREIFAEQRIRPENIL